MSDQENTPVVKRCSQRKRTKVNYKDFEMSLDSPELKKGKKSDDSEAYVDETQVSDDNEDDDNEAEASNTNEMSEYELQMQKNVMENRKIMMQLGLLNGNENNVLMKAAPKPMPKPKVVRKRVKKNISNIPTKCSQRLQNKLNKTPEAKPIILFEDSPTASPLEKEEKTRLEEEELPMNENGETTDFLDSLKSSISQDSKSASEECVDELIDNVRRLQFATAEKVNDARVQSMCIHPTEDKLLVVSGSKTGDLGIWNADDGNIANFTPHLRAINCLTINPIDPTKFYSTSFDGTVRCADINSSSLKMVYETNDKTNNCHLTWHSHVDINTLIVAHGTGEAAIVDVRDKNVQHWFHCHPRSIRTIHQHPLQPHYFLTASGIGESKIWDLRGTKKHTDEYISEMSMPKGKRGLTSGFFSPDGSKIATTCNDDFIRIYDVSDLSKPQEMNRIVHDNHTGRWLSVFKAMWHTHSSDLIIVGSMLQPRRIQLFSSSGRLVQELKDDDNLLTVTPVIALHPSMPILVGGNSSGKCHLFSTPALRSRFVSSCD